MRLEENPRESEREKGREKKFSTVRCGAVCSECVGAGKAGYPFLYVLLFVRNQPTKYALS